MPGRSTPRKNPRSQNAPAPPSAAEYSWIAAVLRLESGRLVQDGYEIGWA
jgi:hypothetical protein